MLELEVVEWPLPEESERRGCLVLPPWERAVLRWSGLRRVGVVVSLSVGAGWVWSYWVSVWLSF